MWRTLLTNQLQSVGRKLALLIFSWNKWLIESKTSLCFPEDYKGAEEETIHQSSSGSKASNTWHFLRNQVYSRMAQKTQGGNILGLFINLRNFEEDNGKKAIWSTASEPPWSKTTTQIGMASLSLYAHVGLILAVCSLVLRDCGYTSAASQSATGSKAPSPRTVIQEDYAAQEGSQPHVGITDTANSHRAHRACTFPHPHSSVCVQKSQWSPRREKKKARGSGI